MAKEGRNFAHMAMGSSSTFQKNVASKCTECHEQMTGSALECDQCANFVHYQCLPSAVRAPLNCFLSCKEDIQTCDWGCKIAIGYMCKTCTELGGSSNPELMREVKMLRHDLEKLRGEGDGRKIKENGVKMSESSGEIKINQSSDSVAQKFSTYSVNDVTSSRQRTPSNGSNSSDLQLPEEISLARVIPQEKLGFKIGQLIWANIEEDPVVPASKLCPAIVKKICDGAARVMLLTNKELRTVALTKLYDFCDGFNQFFDDNSKDTDYITCVHTAILMLLEFHLGQNHMCTGLTPQATFAWAKKTIQAYSPTVIPLEKLEELFGGKMGKGGKGPSLVRQVLNIVNSSEAKERSHETGMGISNDVDTGRLSPNWSNVKKEPPPSPSRDDVFTGDQCSEVQCSALAGATGSDAPPDPQAQIETVVPAPRFAPFRTRASTKASEPTATVDTLYDKVSEFTPKQIEQFAKRTAEGISEQVVKATEILYQKYVEAGEESEDTAFDRNIRLMEHKMAHARKRKLWKKMNKNELQKMHAKKRGRPKNEPRQKFLSSGSRKSGESSGDLAIAICEKEEEGDAAIDSEISQLFPAEVKRKVTPIKIRKSEGSSLVVKKRPFVSPVPSKRSVNVPVKKKKCRKSIADLDMDSLKKPLDMVTKNGDCELVVGQHFSLNSSIRPADLEHPNHLSREAKEKGDRKPAKEAAAPLNVTM